jgi:hypothetical protein
MRPVERGAIPQIGGVNKIVSDYKDWRFDLLGRIGNYCSYCNMPLNDSPQVEHVTPKNPQPGQPAGALLDWNNMLLACGPCNRAKGNKPNNTSSHYIPDHHNTHLAFDYIVIDHPTEKKTKACITIPKKDANIDAFKAQNTINLCELAALVTNKRATDLRWKYRFEAWHSANVIWRPEWDDWGHNRPIEFARLLVNAATGKGFFSIWFQAFQDIPLIKQELMTGFLGTHIDSFGTNDFTPIIRVAGDL